MKIRASAAGREDALFHGLFPFAKEELGKESGDSLFAAGAAGLCRIAYAEWLIDRPTDARCGKNALSGGIFGENAELPKPVSWLGGEKAEWGEG
jgi:hypothetical protein